MPCAGSSASATGVRGPSGVCGSNIRGRVATAHACVRVACVVGMSACISRRLECWWVTAAAGADERGRRVANSADTRPRCRAGPRRCHVQAACDHRGECCVVPIQICTKNGSIFPKHLEWQPSQLLTKGGAGKVLSALAVPWKSKGGACSCREW